MKNLPDWLCVKTFENKGFFVIFLKKIWKKYWHIFMFLLYYYQARVRRTRLSGTTNGGPVTDGIATVSQDANPYTIICWKAVIDCRVDTRVRRNSRRLVIVTAFQLFINSGVSKIRIDVFKVQVFNSTIFGWLTISRNPSRIPHFAWETGAVIS